MSDNYFSRGDNINNEKAVRRVCNMKKVLSSLLLLSLLLLAMPASVAYALPPVQPIWQETEAGPRELSYYLEPIVVNEDPAIYIDNETVLSDHWYIFYGTIEVRPGGKLVIERARVDVAYITVTGGELEIRESIIGRAFASLQDIKITLMQDPLTGVSSKAYIDHSAICNLQVINSTVEMYYTYLTGFAGTRVERAGTYFTGHLTEVKMENCYIRSSLTVSEHATLEIVSTRVTGDIYVSTGAVVSIRDRSRVGMVYFEEEEVTRKVYGSVEVKDDSSVGLGLVVIFNPPHVSEVEILDLYADQYYYSYFDLSEHLFYNGEPPEDLSFTIENSYLTYVEIDVYTLVESEENVLTIRNSNIEYIYLHLSKACTIENLLPTYYNDRRHPPLTDWHLKSHIQNAGYDIYLDNVSVTYWDVISSGPLTIKDSIIDLVYARGQTIHIVHSNVTSVYVMYYPRTYRGLDGSVIAENCTPGGVGIILYLVLASGTLENIQAYKVYENWSFKETQTGIDTHETWHDIKFINSNMSSFGVIAIECGDLTIRNCNLTMLYMKAEWEGHGNVWLKDTEVWLLYLVSYYAMMNCENFIVSGPVGYGGFTNATMIGDITFKKGVLGINIAALEYEIKAAALMRYDPGCIVHRSPMYVKVYDILRNPMAGADVELRDTYGNDLSDLFNVHKTTSEGVIELEYVTFYHPSYTVIATAAGIFQAKGEVGVISSTYTSIGSEVTPYGVAVFSIIGYIVTGVVLVSLGIRWSRKTREVAKKTEEGEETAETKAEAEETSEEK